MASPRGIPKKPSADAAQLRCNFVLAKGPRCNAVSSVTYGTSCNHLFCSEHASAWFKQSDECPICKNGKVHVFKLPDSKSRKSFVAELVGLPPNDVLAACGFAVQFWLTQKFLDFEQYQGLLKSELAREAAMKKEARCRLDKIEGAKKKLVQGIEAIQRQQAMIRKRRIDAQKQTEVYQAKSRELRQKIQCLRDKAAGLVRSRSPRRPLDIASSERNAFNQFGSEHTAFNQFGSQSDVGSAHRGLSNILSSPTFDLGLGQL